jgi:outer membrane immunogenic protein
MLTAANAAELPSGGMKEPPIVPYSWAGWYAGIDGGGAWHTGDELRVFECDKWESVCVPGSSSNSFVAKREFAPSGGFGGGELGFNWQIDRLVYGVETDIQGVGANESASITDGVRTVHMTGELDWFGTLRTRVGLTFLDQRQLLVYFTSGLSYGGVQDKLTGIDLNDNKSVSFSKSSTLVGYVFGAGFEYAFSPCWSVKAEWQFINFTNTTDERFSHTDWALTTTALPSAQHSFNTARIGINYHFQQEYVPLK